MRRILFLHATGQSDGTAAMLTELGYVVHHAASVRQAMELLRASTFDVLVSDARLSDVQNWTPFLGAVRSEFPHLPLIESSRLRTAVASALDRSFADDQRNAPDPDPCDSIVATSAAMRATLEWVARVGPSDIPVLLTGESGTGKELLARALHASGHRRTGPFIAINCGAIPEELAEVELFGCQKGAFTGAHADKAGLLEVAHGGTVLLDEIGEMSLATQVRLLRFLEDAEVRRVGQTRSRRVDVRVIAATNRNLRQEVARARYRADLFFRLSAGARRIPALRERPDDIEPLVTFWISKLRVKLAPRVHGVSPRALSMLRSHAWPGNVRELRNVLEHALLLTRGEVITEIELGAVFGATPHVSENTTVAAVSYNPAQSERERVLAALQQHRWNRNRAAESLGISRSTLWRRLGRYGLKQREAIASLSDSGDALE
jgi:DNA-binding NtrC family response regulator